MTEWRAHRERTTVSDDEDDDTTRDRHLEEHELESDDDLPGLITPEDDGDNSEDEENESVDDWIEAEWETEWAELGELYSMSKSS